VQEPEEPVQEVHAAVNPEGCKALEKRLKKMGLAIDLVEAVNTGRRELPYDCIFEGEDADSQADRFSSPHEKSN
jgi:hypothetical protein